MTQIEFNSKSLPRALSSINHSAHALRFSAVSHLAALFRQPSVLFSWIVLATVLLAALLPEIFTHADPLRGVARERLLAPSGAHWFGTDQMGRDLFARVVYGTAESVKAVVLAVVVGLFAGSAIGLVAGYVGRWVDDLLMRVMDVFLAVPTLLIALAVINALGFGTLKIAVAVGIGTIAIFARVMRSEVLKVRSLPYIEATRFAE